MLDQVMGTTNKSRRCYQVTVPFRLTGLDSRHSRFRHVFQGRLPLGPGWPQRLLASLARRELSCPTVGLCCGPERLVDDGRFWTSGPNGLSQAGSKYAHIH
jgi:hypothetical protein